MFSTSSRAIKTERIFLIFFSPPTILDKQMFINKTELILAINLIKKIKINKYKINEIFNYLEKLNNYL